MTDINSPRSKCNAKPQSREARLWLVIQKVWRVNIIYIADCLRLWYGTTDNIIADVLGYKKVCTRWVPQMLKPENKLARLTTSHVSLCLYQADPVKFLCIYITREDTLAHHFDSENKLHSKQWKHATSLMPVKFRKTASARKVMASVFWDSEEVLITDYYCE